jgi:hypothetical protein
MIALTDVIARLQSELVPGTFKAVSGAGELQAAADQLKASPSAFVLPSQDRAGPDTAGTQLVRQRVVQQISVVIGLSNLGPKGDRQFDALDELRKCLMRTLIGWTPEGSIEPLNYAGGRMLIMDFELGLLFWGCEFSGAYYVRSNA